MTASAVISATSQDFAWANIEQGARPMAMIGRGLSAVCKRKKESCVAARSV